MLAMLSVLLTFVFGCLVVAAVLAPVFALLVFGVVELVCKFTD